MIDRETRVHFSSIEARQRGRAPEGRVAWHWGSVKVHIKGGRRRAASPKGRPRRVDSRRAHAADGIGKALQGTSVGAHHKEVRSQLRARHRALLRLRLHQHLTMHGIGEVPQLKVRVHRPRGRVAQLSRRASRGEFLFPNFIASDQGGDAIGLTKVIPRVQELRAQRPQFTDRTDASAVVA